MLAEAGSQEEVQLKGWSLQKTKKGWRRPGRWSLKKGSSDDKWVVFAKDQGGHLCKRWPLGVPKRERSNKGYDYTTWSYKEYDHTRWS